MLWPANAMGIFAGTLAFASLAWSAGPRRGLAILGPRRTTALLAAALAYVMAHRVSAFWTGDPGLHRGAFAPLQAPP